MYILKNKKDNWVIHKKRLDQLEKDGLSEEQIAAHFGICRMHLWRIRKKNGWYQKQRSDKGKKRK